jgi:hypothetical protein
MGSLSGGFAAVVMAANTEVSGFSFNPPNGALFRGHSNISAFNLTGSVDINRNSLTDLIAVENIRGPVSVTGNASAIPDGGGTIYISTVIGPVTVSNNRIDTTFNSFVNVAGPLTYTDNSINSFGPTNTLSSNNVPAIWNVSNNTFINSNGSAIAVAILGNSNSSTLSVNLVGNTANAGYGLSNLQYYANGNIGPIIDLGGSKPVSSPLP